MSTRDRTAARRIAIRRLLAEGTIADQQALVSELERLGHAVTQTTVSRDLAALGARKQADPRGGEHYVLAAGRSRSPQQQQELAQRMQQFVVEINSSGNLVVLRTPPGAAHSVAVALDAEAEMVPEILGTIAGDDTIFVATRNPTGGAAIQAHLERLMGTER